MINAEIALRPGAHPVAPELALVGEQVTIFEQNLALAAAQRRQAIRVREYGSSHELVLAAWQGTQMTQAAGSAALSQLHTMVDTLAFKLEATEANDLAQH